jgi:hypothetical protein
MNEKQATSIADALGGETWQSGGDIWLVLLRKPNGRLVVVSDEAICEYDDEEAFDNAKASATIFLH